jgi:hypothetical protein
MPGTFDWDDTEEIGIPKASNEGKLEAIQMAWLDEYKDARGL